MPVTGTYGLWTLRHDAVQLMLVYVVRRLGFQALSCSAGAGNWFGAAGWRAGSTGYRRADVVMPHHLGMGRHLFLDVAVTDPGVGAALTARPSPSSSSSGVAAELRAQKKAQKYEGLAAAVDSSFCPAVIERYGAVCDALLHWISSVDALEVHGVKIWRPAYGRRARTWIVAGAHQQASFDAAGAPDAPIRRQSASVAEECLSRRRIDRSSSCGRAPLSRRAQTEQHRTQFQTS